MLLRVAGIVPESITDGPGIRFAVFAQGCPHNCFGCHNPETHAFSDGYDLEVEEIHRKVAADPLLDGVTFSGGEPFTQAPAFADLAHRIRTLELPIICFTGYTYEEILENGRTRRGWLELLGLVDRLIDGRFEISLRSLDLRFRGSRNQRVIDVPASLAAGRVVETSI